MKSGDGSINIADVRHLFLVYDPLDLAAGVGALQLQPENRPVLDRLETVASAIVGLPVPSRTALCPSQGWRHALNHRSLLEASGLLDDSRVSFTEAFTSFGGSYVVFPGRDQASAFELSRLAQGIFGIRDPLSDSRFRPATRDLLQAVLSVSDTLARMAGLERGLVAGAGTRPGSEIPSATRFSELKHAVLFTESEFEVLLAGAGLTPRVLEPLMIAQGDDAIGSVDSVALAADLPPIVRSGDYFVVVAPHRLLSAARDALLRMAMGMNVADELALRHSKATTRYLAFLLDHLPDISRLEIEDIDHGELPVISQFFEIDKDKVLHVVVLPDLAITLGSGEASKDLATEELFRRLEERLPDLEAQIRAVHPMGEQTEFLHVIIGHGDGRDPALDIDMPESTGSLRLGMSATELEALALGDAGRPLALWQFACAAKELRLSSHVIRERTSDEYEFWRTHDYSYYLGDGPRPSDIRVPPGLGYAGRLKVLERRDLHAVPFGTPPGPIEVIRLGADPRVPTYVPFLPRDDPAVIVLSEALPLPVWIFSGEPVQDHVYEDLYRRIANAIAYWLWQFAPSLNEIGRILADHLNELEIIVVIDPSPAWFSTEDGDEVDDLPGVTCERTGTRVILRFDPGMIALVSRPDNAGERTMLSLLVRAMSDLVAEIAPGQQNPLREDELAEVLDRHAPLGIKKKFYFLEAERNPLLDARFLPSPRLIQPADEHAVLDEVGQFLIRDQGLPIGPIDEAQHLATLKGVVGFLYHKLKETIAGLDPDQLLEILVAANERLLHDQAALDFGIPTRVACYGLSDEDLKILDRQRSEIARALVACRFVIEYVAACPPSGTQPLSLGLYDRIMAIVARINEFAHVRDAIENHLAPFKLYMEPSIRLGIDDGGYRQALDLLRSEYGYGQMVRSGNRFREAWDTETDSELEDMLTRVDGPFTEEFGLAFRDLVEILAAARAVGEPEPTAAKGLSLTWFVDELAGRLGWERERVVQAVEHLAARPRENFLIPPEPYKPSDVYPWNFGRGLSYLRKPLLICVDDEGHETVIWGNRHLSKIGPFLLTQIVNGRLQAHRPAMKQLIADLQHEESEDFNTRVAAVFRDAGFDVREKVKRFGRLRIERERGQDLGDIDVLAVDRMRRRLIAVEVKCFAGARTPAEFGHELDVLVRSTHSDRATIQKHADRTQWIQDRISDVLADFRIPVDASAAWAVEPLLVLDKESAVPFLAAIPVRTLSLERLRQDLGQPILSQETNSRGNSGITVR